MTTFVKKQPGQTDDQLIAQFRKKILNEEVLEEITRKDFYQKPSTLKHEKSKELKRRQRRTRRKKGTF